MAATKKADHDHKLVEVIINARPTEVEKDEITFDDLVVLAFGTFDHNPDMQYTVTYRYKQDNRPTMSLVEGGEVKVKTGMIFNVQHSNRS